MECPNALPPLVNPGEEMVPIAASAYSYRPPSPPFIHIPMPQAGGEQDHLKLLPCHQQVDSPQLTSEDLDIITGNTTQIATDRTERWTYEQRREAQSILSFLIIGPMSVVRDHDYLQREGITKIIVARDTRMSTHQIPLGVQRAAEALGIEAGIVDVDWPSGLIQSFSETIQLINDHLIAVYHRQAQKQALDGKSLVDPTNFRRGKVLLVCETGNDRSTTIAAAYIMAIFGKDMMFAIQFISVQRFCASFNEDAKRILLSWEDILRARWTVAQDSRIQSSSATGTLATSEKIHKRNHGDMVDRDSSMVGMGDDSMVLDVDDERFMGRRAFTPFREE